MQLADVATTKAVKMHHIIAAKHLSIQSCMNVYKCVESVCAGFLGGCFSVQLFVFLTWGTSTKAPKITFFWLHHQAGSIKGNKVLPVTFAELSFLCM